MSGNSLKKRLASLSGLLLVLVVGVVMSQTDEDAAAVQDQADPASQIESAVANTTDQAEQADPAVQGAEAADAQQVLPVEEVPEVPEEILDAIENEEQVQATMDRFVPTEKLSEDRAVSFPNDI